MATIARPSAASTATPAPAEQSISTFFHVEAMNDLDNGQPTLIASSEANHGDLQVVTADQVIAKAAEQHRLISKAVRLALDHEAAGQQIPADKPRTWTVADSDTGMPLNVTCMSGCNTLHLEAASGQAPADEIWCVQYDQANTTELAIGCGNSDLGDWATLSVQIKTEPFHADPAKRIPHASIEVTEDHYIEDLDPDALAVVIDKLERRTAQMRVRHAELVRIRDEYLGRQA
ncbi:MULTISPECIES: DUF6907 domain-containing protein [Streptomyces]|uniref:Uncharacterized protein n=1 Tax=Streptomyces dengpaensis TaxID=2049881 RepID=A0ABM6ST22_9ACTN|nr:MULTISPECIES: hypothetical protein [Streptomyces]AVH57862.1 hypothetical protein C4B68_21200 [Streptomyces dengpaensis]PIB04841.1 hypothetical protein B1C81_31335 [Streptomyces sp. HG99]